MNRRRFLGSALLSTLSTRLLVAQPPARWGVEITSVEVVAHTEAGVTVMALKVMGTYTVPNPPNPAPQISIRLKAYDPFDQSIEDYGLGGTVSVFPGKWVAAGTFPFQGTITCRNDRGQIQNWPANGWWYATADLVVGPANGLGEAWDESDWVEIP